MEANQEAAIKRAIDNIFPPAGWGLRDQAAMAALIATPNWIQGSRFDEYPETARRCYMMADAMLAAREAE